MVETFISLVLAFLGGLGGAPSDETLQDDASVRAEVVRVIDGDTIDVRIGDAVERVRYIGIDAPEEAHEGDDAECYAAEATDANVQLVGGKEVRLLQDEGNRDDYGRLLRYVYVEDVFVNEALLEEGAAITMSIPPNTAHWERFRDAVVAAKAAGRGLWSVCR